MKLTLLLPPKYDEAKWTLSAQMGVRHVFTKALPELSGRKPPYDLQSLKAIQSDFADAGFELYGLEGDMFDMSRIKLGLDGRDEDIEKYRQMIRNLAACGIPVLCYNFMATIHWFRTRTDFPERGGALTTEFNLADLDPEPVPEHQRVSEEKLWDNLRYFLQAVIPTAEEEGIRMALHPDDPPISPLRGLGRIITSADAVERVFRIVESPANGVAFCQANFKAMGEDIEAVSEKWLKEDKVFFVHLRDIEGSHEHFHETFHDNGPTSMVRMLEHYHRCGFDGAIRPDHTPAMYGDHTGKFAGGLSAGYEITGRVFAVGYIKGICEARDIPLE